MNNYAKVPVIVPGKELRYNYTIDTNGVLKNEDTNKVFKWRECKGSEYGLGTKLKFKDCSSSTFSKARILALAFIPNKSGGKKVVHIDGDIYNDSLDNLTWSKGTRDPELPTVENINSDITKNNYIDTTKLYKYISRSKTSDDYIR